MIIRADEFGKCLEQVRGKVGKHGLLLSCLKARAARSGAVPDRLHRLARKYLLSRRRPYFIGETSGGIRFVGDFRDHASVSYALLDSVNDEVVSFLRSRLKPASSDVYWDVGTNLGIVATLIAKHLGPAGHVVAFEPVPETAYRAAATFALNGLTNITLVVAAAGEEDCELEFAVSPEHSDSASGAGLAQANAQVVKVHCRRLDTLEALGLPLPKVIKLDVEGFEMRALRGAAGIIRKAAPEILFEYNYEIAPSMGWHAADAAKFIQECRPYAFETLEDNGSTSGFPPAARSWGHVDVFAKPALQ